MSIHGVRTGTVGPTLVLQTKSCELDIKWHAAAHSLSRANVRRSHHDGEVGYDRLRTCS
jgi:hypothetical protein